MNERLNVRRMRVPEKNERNRFNFDMEWDITDGDWDKIQHVLLGARQSEAWEPFIETAANVKILKNEQAPAITPEEWQDIVATKETFFSRRNQDWQGKLRYAVAMKILKPDADVLTASEKKDL